MKTWLTQALTGLLAVATLTLASCEKDEDQLVITPSNSPTLTTSTNTVALKPGNNKATAITFNWTPIGSFNWSNAENSYTLPVTYSFEIGKQGTNFSPSVSIDAGNGPATTLSVGVLNTSLNSLGLTPGTATPVEVRLKALYAPNTAAYSPVVPLTATSFVCLPPNSDVWTMIGTAAVDWNTDVQLTYDCDLSAYTVTRNLNAGEFKFRLNRGWTVNYGSTTARNSSGTAPLDTKADNNIKVTTAGTYTIIFDITNKTYTLTQ